MKQDHIIQKVFVDIIINNKEKAFALKEDINSFLSLEVFPEIEKYLNALEYRLAGRILQLPHLELNLDTKNSLLDTELKNKIIQLFREELSEITESTEISDRETANNHTSLLTDSQEKNIQTFIYFLENGCMPWWNSGKKEILILERPVFDSLILAESFQKRIIPVLAKRNIQDRIIHQLSDEQIVKLCLSLLKDRHLKINLESDVLRHLSKLSSPDRLMAWRLVLDVLSEYLNVSDCNLHEYILQRIRRTETVSSDLSASSKRSRSPDSSGIPGSFKSKKSDQNRKTAVKIFPFIEEDATDAISELVRSNAFKSAENLKIQDKASDEKEVARYDNESRNHKDLIPDEGQYIENAGLVLIHPFIKTLFEHCDLIHTETQQLTDPERCAHLLHYIATGNTNAPEYHMVFEKFLCNIPFNQSINRNIKLSRKHKTQAKNVIESVQHHWNPMKNSSAALLQNEFFQRSGKLAVTENDYTITVERKTQDILLDRLGWGIGLIKLPWQEKFIFVNW